jgi:glutathione peroxidase
MRICLLIPFIPILMSIYEINVKSADGSDIMFHTFRGKKILIVNTAGGSEMSHQYASLESLRLAYPDSLIIIAAPSNSFGHEMEADSTLLTHLQIQYDIGYHVTTMMNVTGDSISPLYQWLTNQSLNGVMNQSVDTDFQKFLINRDGRLIGFFSARVDPMSEELRSAIDDQ